MQAVQTVSIKFPLIMTIKSLTVPPSTSHHAQSRPYIKMHPPFDLPPCRFAEFDWVFLGFELVVFFRDSLTGVLAGVDGFPLG